MSLLEFDNWDRTLFHLGLGVVSLLLLFFNGCNNSPNSSSSGSKASVTQDEPNGKELLAKVRRAYASADSYSDNASIVFYGVVRATGAEQVTPFTSTSLSFNRPNKLSLTFQETPPPPQAATNYQVVSNGALVRSYATELPDQLHEAIAPKTLTAENFIPEPEMRSELLKNTLIDTLPQLALLLAADAEQPIFAGEETARRLPDKQLQLTTYCRVELTRPDGKRVFWIDRNNDRLRRMEIPIDSQKEIINAQNQYSKIAVWIDFENVSLDAKVTADTFEFAVPEDARRVRRLVPPPPAPPAESLGQPVGEYEFKTLTGELITPTTQDGKVTILDFWATNCPPCRAQTPLLNEVYRHFADSEEVEFLAVSTDSRVVPNEMIANTLANWGGQMPIVRDLGFSGYEVLNIRQTPTLLVIDREGRLQLFHAGITQQARSLIDVVERLVAGEDIAHSHRQQHQEFVRNYEAALDAAEIKDTIINVEIVEPEVPPQKFPDQWQIKKLWHTSDEQLKHPGDVLVVPGNAADNLRVLVLDDAQAIVELDAAGQLVGRHELPQHAERSNGFLRTWTDGQQRLYLASGVGWQQVYVFDERWKPVLTFPDEQHSGIGDVLLDDLAGTGTPLLYVGYWGGRGVQGGTLDGRRLWANRQLDHVLQIGRGPLQAERGKTTWCTSTRGTLLQLAADGQSVSELYVDGQALMYFASQPEGQQHCGLAIDRVGHYRAVGYDADGSVSWEYSLPAGEYVAQIPRLHAVELPGVGEGWLIAAANGTLCWLSNSGELVGQFDTGTLLTGIAIHTDGERQLLLLSSENELIAWQVIASPTSLTGESTFSSPAEGQPYSSETPESDVEETATDDSLTFPQF